LPPGRRGSTIQSLVLIAQFKFSAVVIHHMLINVTDFYHTQVKTCFYDDTKMHVNKCKQINSNYE